MADSLRIDPPLHFGFDRPFSVSDHYNRHRGVWFYRSKWTGEVYGPFKSEQITIFEMSKEDKHNAPNS